MDTTLSFEIIRIVLLVGVVFVSAHLILKYKAAVFLFSMLVSLFLAGVYLEGLSDWGWDNHYLLKLCAPVQIAVWFMLLLEKAKGNKTHGS